MTKRGMMVLATVLMCFASASHAQRPPIHRGEGPPPPIERPQPAPDQPPPSPHKGQGDRYSGAPWASRSAVIARNGVAATSQPLATQIAIDILKAGGSAVDAAIAANAALGLMEPTGSGIGGDLFAIVWDPKTQKIYGLNASGRAPRGQTLEQLQARAKALTLVGDDKGIPDWGSLSVTVPGAVDGWYTLHGRFGRLPMKDILAPAIDYADNGFPATELISKYWASNMLLFERLHRAGIVEEIENARAVYAPAGRTPAEGELFRNPALAETYREIASGGRDAFYKGRIAAVIDGYFRRIKGPLTKADFEAQRSEWVDPVSVNYRGYDVFELPPNGQGIAALQMLNILEGFDLKAMSSADRLHAMIEAKKLAFEDRARFYADPAFVKAPLDKLLSKDYGNAQRQRIDMGKAALEIPSDPAVLATGDTIYLTVADKDGMMVSLIQSNYRGMGSGLAPGDEKGKPLGFMFQDRGAQFALDPGHANAYAPGKRPFHTIIPAFVLKDGQPWLSFGVMGGAMQPQGHVQILVNMIDLGMGVQQAGDAARFHHDGSTEPTAEGRMTDGGRLEVESGIDAATIDALKRRGHKLFVRTGPYGGYQAIQWDGTFGVYRAASEFRKDGQAQGY